MDVEKTTGASRANQFIPWALGCMVAALALLLLVKGRDFLVPLVLAFLVSSIASAGVDRLRSIRFGEREAPYWVVSMLAVGLLALGLLLAYALVSDEFNSALNEAPLFVMQAQEVMLRLAGSISSDLAEVLNTAFNAANPGRWIRLFAGSAGSLLVSAVLILLYVGFLLAEKPWVHAKVEQLFPNPAQREQVQMNIEAIRTNIHHYFLLKTLISLLTAGVVYAIAWAFDLKFALVIALLTFLLNFIPNLGSIGATIVPVLVALVQFDSVSMALGVLAAVGVAQFLLGNVLDPMVTGKSLQMSPLAIVISLTFWSAVWGVVGMFLAVPIMVLMIIVCDQVPALRPVAILLSKTGQVSVR